MMILLTAVGGFFGAIARYLTSKLFKRLNSGFSATMAVNLLGSFLMGLAARAAWDDLNWRTLVITGFLGAFTTFSTFMYDAVELAEEKLPFKSLIYVVLTLIGGLLLFMMGWSLS
ncbi:fluoride efflux transporter CrcB [Chungangia koreensis]|uniref:Fluoride-specific ion channel FluC n=1 Tax=Chungangia koreensis TaxID=752657 RepID=A0ABV8X402_9LACT